MTFIVTEELRDEYLGEVARFDTWEEAHKYVTYRQEQPLGSSSIFGVHELHEKKDLLLEPKEKEVGFFRKEEVWHRRTTLGLAVFFGLSAIIIPPTEDTSAVYRTAAFLGAVILLVVHQFGYVDN